MFSKSHGLGAKNSTRKSIDLKNLVNEIWVDLTGTSESTVELVLDLEHSEPLVGEQPTLKVILENLISNALRYVDDNKTKHTITVRSRSLESNHQVSVLDNGVGIAEENQKLVFGMFKAPG